MHRSKLDVHDDDNVLKKLRDQTGLFLFPVHRLDKPTSGVLLFALDSDSARSVSQQFERQLTTKHYIAVVRGYADKAGDIDYATRDRDARTPHRTPAQTSYQRLATIELPYRIDRYPTTRYSLLRITPKTGRRHQIRQHMKHIKHPIIGDTSYGKTLHNQFFAKHYDCRRLLLHAQQLEFLHPLNGQPVCIRSPDPDAEFKSVLSDPLWQWDIEHGNHGYR